MKNIRVVLPGGEVEEPGTRAVRRRVKVRGSLHARIIWRSGSLRREDRAPRLFIEPAGPVHLCKGPAQKKFSRASVQNVEETVAVGRKQKLPRRSIPLRIDENRNLHRVVVMRIVRRELEIPLQSAGFRVERDDGIGIKIVALPLSVVEVRAGIADSPVRQVELGIVGPGDPHGCSPVRPGISAPAFVSWLAGPRNRIEFPRFLAGFRIISGNKPANAVLAAGHSYQHLVLDYQRRQRHRIARGGIRHLYRPDGMTILRSRWQSGARRWSP